MHIGGLRPSCDEIDLKRAACVKHVISTEVDIDNFKGVCKGTGRIKIRLNEGETAEQVRANFTKLGYTVRDHVIDATKKSVFSTPIL